MNDTPYLHMPRYPRPLLAVLALLVAMAVSIAIGVKNLDWSLFWISRLPRTLAIVLVGASLSVAGLIMQLAVHNRFVEPNTAGTAQGAMLGIVATTLLVPHWPLLANMAVAASCAFAAMLGFLAIARRVPPQEPLLLPLVGLIYGSIIASIAFFFAYQYEALQLLTTWLSGDFSAVLRGRYELLWLGGAIAALLYWFADRLTIIGMGEQMSKLLGLPYRQLVVLAMAAVSLMTALVVITVGSIAFLGLVMPNIVRRFSGDNLRRSLPWVAWLGALLLLIADIIARLVRYPYEVPVSTVFGIIGAVLFFYLLLKPVRHAA